MGDMLVMIDGWIDGLMITVSFFWVFFSFFVGGRLGKVVYTRGFKA